MLKNRVDRAIARLKKRCGYHETDECLNFIGASRGGYGYFRLVDRTISAHRAMWTLFFGKIPDGLYVLHKCDNRRCINPRHLFLGNQIDNMQDMVQKGRHYKKARYQPKVTWAIADAIRADIRPHEQIAAQYGVSRTTVSNIKNGRTWVKS